MYRCAIRARRVTHTGTHGSGRAPQLWCIGLHVILYSIQFHESSFGESSFICKEVLSDRRHRVVVYGATSEWIQSFKAYHREVCWVLFYFSYIPAKGLSWLRSDYMPLQMTPHYWHFSINQHRDLLLLPSLIGT